jgi:hypothetical protein
VTDEAVEVTIEERTGYIPGEDEEDVTDRPPEKEEEPDAD